MSEKKYTLIVQWFDPNASVIKQFYFTYFLPNQQIQMYDIKNKKIFLKKIRYPQIKLSHLYLGNVLSCYGRQLRIIKFGDEFTEKQLGGQQISNKTYAMIKPDAYLNMGNIISKIEEQFIISNLKMFKMKPQDAEYFYLEHHHQPFYKKLVQFMASDYAVGIELVSDNAINKWRIILGPTDTLEAKKNCPKSIRALFGTDTTKNACHGSDSLQSAKRQLSFIFSSTLKVQPYFSNCTLCIIKPHIVKSGQVGRILQLILQKGFQISAMQMIWFDVGVAKEFYEVYTFMPECQRMVQHLAVGPSVVLQIRQDNVVQNFRKLCGPYDPIIAKKLQANTIRAIYGVDRVQNAIHCTDLPEDAVLEVNFAFDTLLT